MSIQLTTDFETLVELAEQLSPEDKQALIQRLQETAQERELTVQEWKALFESTVIHNPIKEPFSLRREDWYDDDGR
jgi:hypothetical protein